MGYDFFLSLEITKNVKIEQYTLKSSKELDLRGVWLSRFRRRSEVSGLARHPAHRVRRASHLHALNQLHANAASKLSIEIKYSLAMKCMQNDATWILAPRMHSHSKKQRNANNRVWNRLMDTRRQLYSSLENDYLYHVLHLCSAVLYCSFVCLLPGGGEKSAY